MVRGLFTSNPRWKDVREPAIGVVYSVLHFLIPFTFFATVKETTVKDTVPIGGAARAAAASNTSYSDLEAFFTGRSAWER